MFGFDSKEVFFCLFSIFFWFEMEQPKKNIVCFLFFWMDMINQDIKKTKNRMFFVFETFQCRKPNLTCWKAKKTVSIVYVFWHFDWSYPFKNQKTKVFLFCPFQNPKIKTTKTRENKTNIFWVKTKHSLNNFFLGGFAWVVFKFSRFCFLFSMWPKTSMVVGISCMKGWSRW